MSSEHPEQQGHEQGGQIEVAIRNAADIKQSSDTWGQPISAKRQSELQSYLDRWQAETDAGTGHGDRKGPFDKGSGNGGVQLTGADVYWLAKRRARAVFEAVSNLHLETFYVNTLIGVA